jgi:ribosomal protein L37AE/L43A
MSEEYMSAQAEVMVSRTSTKSQNPLYIGIAVTGFAGLPAASVLYILSVYNTMITPIVMVIASAAAMGVIIGLIARFTLPRRETSIRWLVALFGLSIGMTFLGWLSSGSLGFDLIDRSTADPDWLGLIRFVGSAAVAWVAIRAWGEKSSATPRTRSRARKGAKPRGASLKVKKPRSTKQRARRKWTKVRLKPKVEHRCPYCLEVVKTRDPRGVVKCSTCKTLHHADCWGMTGTCQVPHHNS